MDLPTLLRHFIEHRKEIVVRRTRFDLRKAEERAHILEGLVKALDILDELIALIRGSRTPPEAKSGLIEQLAVQRRAGAGHSRHAPAAPDGPRAREDRRRVRGGPGHSSRRLREILGSETLVLDIIGDELREIKEAVRRRAPHRDRPARPATSPSKT